MYYKGYVGLVEYSDKDKVFHGKIAMIDDLVTFEADNVNDLEKNFRESVRDYLETCKKLHKKPQKTFRGVFNIRIRPGLHKKAYLLALKQRISLNRWVENAIEKYVK